MEKQVLSIEQMKHLQGLGLDISDASMHYQFLPTADSIINGTDEVEKEPSLFVSQPNMEHEYPTYTLQDIIELLPLSIQPNPDEGTYYLNLYYYDLSWVVDYLNNEGDGSYFAISSDGIMESAYQMLCWVIENGYLETNK